MFSLVFSCQWGSQSIAFSVSLVSVVFRVCTVQWVILRLYSSVSAVFRALAVHQASVMFMSCSESTLWRSSTPAQFLSTTVGHLRTKYNVKLLFFKSIYLSMHNDTRFGTDLFSVCTHQGNLLVSSRLSTGDLNFCVHSIPLWEPCVEKIMCSEHQCIGLLETHCSNYVNVKSANTWHKAEQIIFGRAWMSDYICTYICLLVHLDMCVWVYE